MTDLPQSISPESELADRLESAMKWHRNCAPSQIQQAHAAIGNILFGHIEPIIIALRGHAQCSEDQRTLDDMTLAHNVRKSTIEECAKVAEAQAKTFLSPQYASNQPFGSLCERFACEEVAKAIRALTDTRPDRKSET